VYQQEQIKPYDADGSKGEQVEEMFDNIAPTYDTLNHRLSWNIDKWWRSRAINMLKPYAPKMILDVATGTGDFAIQSARRLKPAHIHGIDISDGMMNIGRQKVKAAGLDRVIDFSKDDCMGLSIANDSYDAVMSAFGIRNFPSLDKGLAEMRRVLKPNGVCCLVELTAPQRFPMRQLFHIYSHTVLPVYGRLISNDSKAYHYLTATIEAFPQGERMMQVLKKAGFRETSFQRLTFGICTVFMARK